jgi:hypothetical protein
MYMKKSLTKFAKNLVMTGLLAVPLISEAQLKVSGTLFGDYAAKLHTDSLAGKRKNTSEYNGLPVNYMGFNIRRAYLNFDYDINSKIHAEAVLAHESTIPAGPFEILPDNNSALFLKYADVRIKQIFTGSDLIIGQQRTPTFATAGGSEPIWQYRPIERTITDFRRLASSTDLGVGLEGKYLDGALGYNFLFGNNLGAKVDETLPTGTGSAPRVYGDVYYKFWQKRIEVQVYGDYSAFNYNYDSSKTKFQTTSSTVKAFIAYVVPRFTLGFEVYQQTITKAANDITGEVAATSWSGVNALVPPKAGAYTASLKDLRDVSPFGLSIFAHAIIIADNDTAKVSKRAGNMQDGQKGGILSVFARYDSYNPDQNMTDVLAVNTKNKSKLQSNEVFITAGLDWQAWKNVHIMPNIWYNGFMQKNDQTVSNLPNKDDSEMVARLTFWYQF